MKMIQLKGNSGQKRPVFLAYSRYGTPKVSAVICSSRGTRSARRDRKSTIYSGPAILSGSRSGFASAHSKIPLQIRWRSGGTCPC